MVGGRVIEVCAVKEFPGRLFVDVCDRPYSRLETCTIYVERNETSERIQVGDSIWWQGRNAMWTPQDSQRLRAGVDHDIVIPRIGYSGVRHPRDWPAEDRAAYERGD